MINGALEPMSRELGMDSTAQGWVTGSLAFAAAIGALTCGRISDRYGRRTTIIGLSTIFFIGALTCVFAPNVAVLITGRTLLGLAVGGASAVVPVFLAELAPYEIRGSLSGRNELMVVGGQLAAFIVNALIGNLWGEHDGVWRWMFAICTLPAIGLFVGMLRVPESPRWLLRVGKREQALEVMKRIRSTERAEAEIADIERTLQAEAATSQNDAAGKGKRGRARLVHAHPARRYSRRRGPAADRHQLDHVLRHQGAQEAGFSESAALIANIAPGTIAVLGSIMSLRLMERVRRRVMVMTGYVSTAFFHVLIAGASILLPADNAARPWILLVLIVCFVGAMQTCLNVSTWVIMSELFPLHVRAAGMGISAFSGWMMNGVLSLAFPVILGAVGLTGSFIGFAVVNVVIALLMFRNLPETRGVSLEQVERGVMDGSIYPLRTRALDPG